MFAPKEKIEEFENVLFYHFREAMGESILALNEEATNELFTFMFEKHYLEGDLTASKVMKKFSYITEEQDAHLIISMFDNSNPHYIDIPSY